MKNFVEEIKEIVGAEHFEDFELTVAYECGEQDEWDCDENNMERLLELAKLCKEWYTDSDVMLARKIDAAIRVEFKKGSKTLFGLESWGKYDNADELIDTARSLNSTHLDDVRDMPEFKEYFDD